MKKSKVLDRETAIQKMRKEAKEGVVAVAIILIGVIGLGIGLAQSILNRDEDLSLGFIERGGVELKDMSTAAWVASLSYYALFFAAFLAILALIIYFFYSVKKTGIPFTIKNSRILTALAVLFMLLALSPFMSIIVYTIVGTATDTAFKSNGTEVVSWSFDLGVSGGFSFLITLVLSGFLYTLARIFRYGSFLQDDDEGLI
ncbi:MAG: hypothetical protein IKZ87_06840 [Actinomycetaceae bacterium]|nr:hypothetical protein [Actinomycetaceae bacterium]